MPGALALTMMVVAALIGYPFAYAMTRGRGLALVMPVAAVVLPYFTSAIVRTYSFMVLLGRNGLVNQALIGLGVTTEPLSLMYNRFDVVGMAYVLLPYMVLTLYAVMRGIDPGLMRAAQETGASGPQLFRCVFLPLTLQGVVTGCLMVLILAIGFFVTPALMGGPGDTVIAMFIEREVEITLNWPVAAVTSVILLAATLVLYVTYCRFANLRQVLG